MGYGAWGKYLRGGWGELGFRRRMGRENREAVRIFRVRGHMRISSEEAGQGGTHLRICWGRGHLRISSGAWQARTHLRIYLRGRGVSEEAKGVPEDFFGGADT